MNRALVVIDVQESFRVRTSDWQKMHNPNIAERVNRLVAAARAGGDHVVWVLHAEPGSDTAFDPALGHVTLMAELERRDEEHLVVKTSVNAFTTTNLQQYLVQHGVGEVVICGIRTEQCCETTARVAADLGFDVVFVTDATTTSAIPGLTAEQLMERTERVLEEREFARIATTDEIVAAASALA